MHRLLSAPAEYAEEFRDGLGVRYLRPDSAGSAVHVLRLSRDLAAARTAVLDRVDRLSTLRLGPYPPLRSAGAPPDDSFALEVVSDHVPGVRLIEILELASAGRLTIEPEASLHIVRQVLGALASLHESRGVSHGAIGPERLVVTARGQVMLTDYVLGLALEQIGYPPARFWMEMRIPVLLGRAPARFDEQTDVLQVGVLALALLAGRPLDVDDYPDRMSSLVDSLGWRAGRDGQTPLIDAVGDWLRGVLQLGTRRRPQSARQAQTRLEGIVNKWRPAGASASPLKALLGDYHRGRGAGVEARRKPMEQIAPPAFALARRRTLTLVPDTGSSQPEERPIAAAPACAESADAIVAPAEAGANDLPELRVRRRPSLVIVPDLPEPVPEDAIQPPAPMVPPVPPTISPAEPEPVEAVVRDRAASVFMHAALAFLRAVRRALSILVTRGAAGLAVAARVSWAAGKVAARGLRVGAAASTQAASFCGRVALAGGRVMAVRGFEGLAVGGRAARATLRWLLHLAGVLGPVAGRFGRSAASLGVRAVYWSLRMTRRGVVAAVRAAVPAASRAASLSGRGLEVGADAIGRLRDVHVGRPVVMATVILACSWPGVRLARAWWPVIQQRFDTSSGNRDALVPTDRASISAGTLRIRSEPSGAEVWLEGKLEGQTPLTLEGVEPGKRSVLLKGPAGSIRTDVNVRPGEAIDVIVPIYSGWIAVFAPIELRILERGTLVGTTASGRMLIGPGEHVLDLVSEQYGFAIRRTAVVKPGEVTALNIELPPVPLEISAPAGSEVWLDGRLLGTAPLERQTAPPGTSVIVMRHPTLGERQQTATLTYRQTPNRAVF